MAPYAENPALFDLANMPEDTFKIILAGSIKSVQDKKDAEKQAEIDRLAKIEEDKRIRADNERLKREQEANDAEMRRLKEVNDAKMRRLKEDQDAVVRKFEKEQEDLLAERQRLLQDAKDRELAEKKALADAEKAKRAEERKSRLAPDKTKLEVLAQQITDLKLPEVKSEEAKKVVGDVKALLDQVVKFINDKLPNL